MKKSDRKFPRTSKEDEGCVREVIQVTGRQWNVVICDEICAQIHLDYNKQINKVVFMNNDVNIHRWVKELALSHAIQFVMHRAPMSCQLLAILPERDLTEYTCENLMNFDKIPQGVIAMNNDDLDMYLSKFVSVVEGRFATPEEMLGSLLLEIKEQEGVELEIKKAAWNFNGENIKATFEIQDGINKFRVWKNSDGPTTNNEYRLNFTAPYHPVMQGKESIGLINGSTDAYIGGSDIGIYSIYSPEEARTSERSLGSWSYINHPFYAEGETLGIEFSAVLCMAQNGYQNLFNILVAALNRGNKYISVSGGFDCPFDHVSNVLNRKGVESPTGKHGAYDYRGSEGNCVWEHQVLEAEGQLGKAIFPSWFLKEGWLAIFADEEKKFA